MILADTSIWTDHLRSPSPELSTRLIVREVLMHPFILGELALGNLPRRASFLADLSDMPGATVADDKEVLQMIEANRLNGSGIGWVDAHLIASARLFEATALWTRDKRMFAVAQRLGVTAHGLR
ncbi:type II toxin-antitoxin system VapC family toxin [Brevundimonas sp.]|uniref:type II toxin-antitoxin system VapC family toxin n=1 Tax=Brevundimonas sp. TaxID=1871086 RepID=UPI003F6F866A